MKQYPLFIKIRNNILGDGISIENSKVRRLAAAQGDKRVVMAEHEMCESGRA